MDVDSWSKLFVTRGFWHQVASMNVRQAPGRGVYGASIIFGVLTIAELIFLLLPKLRPLTQLFDIIELILGRISPGLKGIVSASPLLQTAIAIGLVWVSAWVALEAFSRVSDGLSLWRNIAHDSCGPVRKGKGHLACTLSRWVLTITTAPLLIVWALIQRLRYGHQIVTVGFITIDPGAIIGYLKHLALGLALLLSIAVLIRAAVS